MALDRSRLVSSCSLAAACAAIAVLSGCGMAEPRPAEAPAATMDARTADSGPVRVVHTVPGALSEESLARGQAPAAYPASAPSPAPPAERVAKTARGEPAGGQPPPPPPAQPTTPATTTPPDAAGQKADPAADPAQSRDFVIYSARFTMAVYQVDQGLAAVERIAREQGGYLGQKKDREITIRVPRAHFDPAVVAIDKVGDVLHRDIQAQDVTDEHVDLEIRIKNARAMQRRLSDLLVKASVKDALEIEKELHRVTAELELLEGKMKLLRDKIAFSTITVAFEPRGAAIQSARVRLPFTWLGTLNLPALLTLSEDK